MLSYALLLDGGFVKRKLAGGKLASLTVDEACSKIQEFVDALNGHPNLANHRLHRIYWYDASPFEKSVKHPLTGELIEYGSTDVYRWCKQFHEKVVQLPMFALRKGETSHEGWALNWKKLDQITKRASAGAAQITAVDLKSAIKQKGVDMRIGMDIAALTLKKHVAMIVLVTSDSDFVPAMKFARREGAQLALFTLSHKVKDEMVANADLVIRSQVKELLGEVAMKAVAQPASSPSAPGATPALPETV